MAQQIRIPTVNERKNTQPGASSGGGGGFLSVLANAGQEALDFGKGLGSLILAPVRDVGVMAYDAGAQLNPFNAEDETHNLVSDDILKNLVFNWEDFGVQDFIPGQAERSIASRVSPAIQEDVSERYGMLLPGGRPAGEIADVAKERPLSYLLDALMGASAVGGAATKAARVASKSPGAAGDLANIARSGSTADAGLAARFTNRVLPGTAEKAALDLDSAALRASGDIAGAEGLAQLAERVPLAGTRARMSPTGAVDEVVNAYNPLRRALVQKPTEFLTSKRIDKVLDPELRALEEIVEIGEATPAQVGQLKRLRALKETAEEAGIERITRQPVSNYRVSKAAAKLSGGLAPTVRTRIAAFSREVSEQLKNLRPDQVDEFHITTFDTPNSAGRMPYEDVRRFIDDEQAYSATPQGMELADAIRADVELLDELANPTSPAYARLADEEARAFTNELATNGRTFGPGERRYQLTADEQATLQARTAQTAARTQEMGRRYIEGLSEHLVEQGDDLAKAFDGVNVTRHKEFSPALRDAYGARAYAVQFEHSYLPLKTALRSRATGKLPRTGKPFESLVDDVYDALGGPSVEQVNAIDALVLDDTMKALGRKSPQYFPHIAPNPKLTSLLRPSRKGKPPAPAGLKHSGGVLINRYLKGQKDAYLTNPAEAYVRRGAEFIRHQEYIKLLEDTGEKLGRRINSADEVGVGEKLLSIDNARYQIAKRHEILDRADEALAAGEESSSALRAATKASLEAMPEEMAAMFSRKPTLYAIPESAAKHLDTLAKERFGGANMRLFYDGGMNLWRQTVLYTRPDYFFNNAFGNSAFHFIQGGNPFSILRQLSPKYLKQVRKIMDEAGVTPEVEWGYFAKESTAGLDELSRAGLGKYANAVKKTTPARVLGRGRDFMQKLTTHIESAARRQSYMTALEKQGSIRGVKGAGKSFWRSQEKLERLAKFGADETIAKAAVADVNKFLNDYSALRPFEQNVIRRFIFPFYAFWKHQAKMTAMLPFEHPFKARLFELVGQIDEDMNGDMREGLPEWMQTAQPLGPGAFPEPSAC
jgi:hypothetical protein